MIFKELENWKLRGVEKNYGDVRIIWFLDLSCCMFGWFFNVIENLFK